MIIHKITKATPELHLQIVTLLGELTDKDLSFSLDDFNSIVNSENSILIGALENNSLIGILTLVIIQIPTGKNGRIEDVVVNKNHRGKGIGEKLSLEAIKISKELNLNELFLTSNPNRTEANRLYQRMGFQIGVTNSYHYKITK